MGAEVVRAADPDGTDYGKEGFGAHLLKTGRAPAGTRNRPMIGIWWLELQQLRQCRSSGLVHGSPDSCLHTLQIEAAWGCSIAKNDVQQSIYFTGDFLLDGLRRFFPGQSAGLAPLGEGGRSSDSHPLDRRSGSRICDTRRSRFGLSGLLRGKASSASPYGHRLFG
jgi:hypothetical protein